MSGLPALAPLLGHCGHCQKEGAGSGVGLQPPPLPSLSRLCSTQAGSGPGGARGCICHRSLAVCPEAPGEGARSEARAGVRGLPRPSRGVWASDATPSPPPGLEKVSRIQPPPPIPSAQQPGPHDALAASPQWSPQPVLNLNDSCPQPSQLQLISEAFQGPGRASHQTLLPWRASVSPFFTLVGPGKVGPHRVPPDRWWGDAFYLSGAPVQAPCRPHQRGLMWKLRQRPWRKHRMGPRVLSLATLSPRVVLIPSVSLRILPQKASVGFGGRGEGGRESTRDSERDREQGRVRKNSSRVLRGRRKEEGRGLGGR